MFDVDGLNNSVGEDIKRKDRAQSAYAAAGTHYYRVFSSQCKSVLVGRVSVLCALCGHCL